ncbi:16 kDa beta-galactoside-binding lectin-like isoform X1 [Hemicordylus capensis]|uniref:16 kDa beta-galactoside-binding lectin-like isoform X1 n=1 Tax=Hemicordylus capensis TaxID=884348 RepID=UPI002303F306|nr:16 kDa beta-galactoside-binding lectin-like isoform X1 [Hemicordylus capensis]
MECVMTATGLKIQPGEGLEVKGKILPDAKDFAVNLGKDCDNLVLHFNPRFDNHGDVNTIVCNSKQDGAWGEEERDASFPFQQGEKAQVSFTFDTSEVKVKVGEDHEIVFPNRLGLEGINFLSVEGDFKVKVLKFL